MTISAICSNGHHLQAKDAHAGRSLACPVCGISVIVPMTGDDVIVDVDPMDLQVDDEFTDQPGQLPNNGDRYCPSCKAPLTFQVGSTGKSLECSHCNQVLATVVDDQSALEIDGLILAHDQPASAPNHDRLMKLAIVGCGAGVGMFVVAIIGVGVLLLRSSDDPKAPTLPTTGDTSIARAESEAARPDSDEQPAATSQTVQQPIPSSSAPATAASNQKPDRINGWREIHEAGRRSNGWLYVNIMPQPNGSRRAQIKVDGGSRTFADVLLADGEGAPLFECNSFTLKYRGWASAGTVPETESKRRLLQNTTDTELYRICKLTNFGTGSFNRGDDEQQNFDHRHVWSPEGEHLYVLSGLRRGTPKQWLRKVNTQTWEVECELQLPEDVSDITWTAQGLVVIADPLLLGTAKYPEGKTWVRLVPSNKQLEQYTGGILLLDPETLSVRRAWVTPRVQEVAGNANSDLIYLRSPQNALLVVNVKSGELLSCYSYHDLSSDVGNNTAGKSLHLLHPQLSADGTSLTSHGMNNIVPIHSRVANNTLGARSVHQFDVAGALVQWKQSRVVGGIRSRFTRRADVGVGEDYLCLPEQRFDIVSTTDMQHSVGKLTLSPETAVVVDSPSKSLFLCWPDWMARQLRFRMIRGTTDTECTLETNITPNDEPTKFSQTRFPEESRVHHNLWPFEMSASPNGRGAIVFARDAVYWVQPNFGPGVTWAFNASTTSNTPASGNDVADAAVRDNSLVRRRAEMLTRGKAATVLLHVPSKKRLGTAFSIDEDGHVLTNSSHVEELSIGSEVPLIVNAGGFHQRTTTAKLVRMDSSVGVALLKTEAHPDLVPLQLGHDDSLSETTSLTAFGYTRNAEHDVFAGLYPSVGVKPGVITALRKLDGELATIQFDGALLPGNSGGPVIDASGQVVGVVRSGIELFGLNFLVPVSQLRKLDWPEIGDDVQLAQEFPAMELIVRNDATKAATALVVLPLNRGFGSAFCVDDRGFFATNSHVVEGVKGSTEVTLVLHSGEPGEQLVQAKVVRSITDSDLALLKLVDNKEDLTALKLSSSDELADQMSVTAFGFPFGDALAVRGKRYPSVSANLAKIQVAKTSALDHESFQFQTQVNPGNSGGPVVDATGEVVGVVFATQLGTRKSFAIPVSRLRELMFSPDIVWQRLAVDYSDRRQETVFPVTVTPYLRSLDGLELEVSLKPERGPKVVYPLSATDSAGSYELRAPLISPAAPEYVNATFSFRAGSVSGIAEDHQVNVGAVTYSLSTAPEEAFHGEQSVTGLEDLSITIGDDEYSVDGTHAISATITPLRPSHVTYTIVARQDGDEVARTSGQIDVSIRQSSDPIEHRFERQLRQLWAEGVLSQDLPALKVTATFEEGTISGLSSDRKFRVDRLPESEEYDLSEVTWIKHNRRASRDNPSELTDSYQLNLTGIGRQLNRVSNGTKLPGLERVPLRVGATDVIVDLTKAKRVDVEPLRAPNVNTFPLRTRIADVAVGQSGKWLVLHLDQLEKIVVFDTATQSIRHHIPLADANVLFAASVDKLLVVFPELMAIQRWDLTSGKHEQTAELPHIGSVGAVALGSGGTGPLLMHGYDSSTPPAPRWTLIDLRTLRPTKLAARLPTSLYPASPPLTASVNGSAFGTNDLLLLLDGMEAKAVTIDSEFPSYVSKLPFLVTPGTTSRQLYYRNSIFTTEGELLGETPKHSVCLPTFDDEYSLSFAYLRTRSARKAQLTIHANENGKLRSLIVLDSIPFDAVINPKDGKLPLRKRYYLYPKSRRLISIPLSDDVLVIRDLPNWK